MMPARVAPRLSVGELYGSRPARFVGEDLREPEVEHLDRAVAAQLDVRRLEIAVNDPLLVRSGERLGDLSRNRQGFGERNRPLRDAIGQRRPFHEFEHERRHVAGILESVDGRDVLMVERCEHVRLALESRCAIDTADARVADDFQRHVAMELGVARAIDLPHTAGAHERDDFVRAESRAGKQRHELFG